MKRLIFITMALLSLSQVFAATTNTNNENTNGVDRYAIYIGSNKGGKGREQLLYAGSDAQNFQKAMSEIGGVSDSNSFVLIDPSKEAIDETLNKISTKITTSESHAKRSEFIFYYSGHSDENALLLGDVPYEYSALKAAITEVPSDIHVVILDSCYSGNFIRTKGGQKRKPFLIDDSSVVTGHAYLSSSSTNEYSQESDEIESSYFTNAMITGLRGAADASGDNKVTLNELYSYAFNDTLSKTEDSKAGPQHPNFNITLVGSGDLVLSDISTGEAMLSLSKEAKGRFIIRNADGKLISEINKSAGQPIFMALPAAQYSAVIIDEYSTKQGYFYLNKDQVYVLDQNSLSTINRKTNRVRGEVEEEVIEEPVETRGSRRRFDSDSEDSDTLDLVFGDADPDFTEDTEEDIDDFDFSNMAPVNFSFVPGVSFLGLRSENTLFSFGIFGTLDHNIYALQYSGLGNIATGNVYGVQASGLFNIAKDVNGLQTAGLFDIAKDVNGVQAAGLFNTANDVHGAQGAGLFNIAHSIHGIQGAGLFNSAEEVHGVQAAGLLNIAEKVKGAQFGLINIAESSDGVAFGLINIIKDGMHHLGFNWDTNDMFDTFFQSGTKHFFITIGHAMNRKDVFTQYDEDKAKLHIYYAGFGTEHRFSFSSLDFEFLWKYAYNADMYPSKYSEYEEFDFENYMIPSCRITWNPINLSHFDFSIGGSFDFRTDKNEKAFSITKHRWSLGDDGDVHPALFIGFKIK